MDSLLASVAAFAERHALFGPGATVVVGVSGGPDSLALLHLLRQLAPRWALRLHVAHLDHLLRPDSGADAAFVAETAAAWQIPTTIARADIAALSKARGTGVEATARAERLSLFATTAREVGATAVAVGHSADDQAETVIMRLLRGAGPSGLAAMRPRRPLDQDAPPVQLVRPLLAASRATIEQYCATHALVPRRDSSNSDPIYLRNSVRGYILPLLKTYNARIVASLGRSARICADEDDLVSQLAEAAWQTVATVEAAGIALDRERFAEQHPALQRRLVRRAVTAVAPDVELEARHLDLALAAIRNGRRRQQLPRAVWIVVDRRRLWITRAP